MPITPDRSLLGFDIGCVPWAAQGGTFAPLNASEGALCFPFFVFPEFFSFFFLLPPSMQRRHFCASALAGTAALAAPAVLAQSAVSSNQFRRLKTPAEVAAPAGKVEVVEFFWYSCPHCYAFEPQFAAWKQKAPAHVSVRRVPVAFNASFVPQQKLFFALSSFENFEALHVAAFKAIHVDKNRLANDEAIFAWAQKQGLDAKRFRDAYTSFSTANAARQATQLQNAYAVDGVPAMGVAGRFYTDGELAGSMSAVLSVVEHLVEQSRKA